MSSAAPVRILGADITRAIADAPQQASLLPSRRPYPHPTAAHEREQSLAARNAIGQILVASAHGGLRPAADLPRHRPRW